MYVVPRIWLITLKYTLKPWSEPESLHESLQTLMARSNENKSCMRIDETWLDITTRVSENSQQNLNQFKVWNKSCNSHPSDRGFLIHQKMQYDSWQNDLV